MLLLSVTLFAKTLVTINDNIEIDSGEVDAIFQNLLLSQGFSPSIFNENDPQVVKLKKSILDNLVSRELLYMEASKNPPKDLNKQVDEQLNQIKGNFKSEEEFQNYLSKMNTSEKEVKNNLSKNIILENYVTSISDKITVSDKEIKEYYNKNKDEFKQEEQVRASHIIISSKNGEKVAQEKINKIYSEIKEGLSFEEAAKKYSEDGSANTGGDLGFFRRGMMVKEFEDVAFNTKKGEISKPFKTEFGYHILMVTDKKEEKQLSLEEAKETIKNNLIAEKTDEKINQIIEKHRKSANINYTN
jgi:parvulin-like peptidyl-prolyl isomerase